MMGPGLSSPTFGRIHDRDETLGSGLMPWSCRRDMTHDGAATIDTMFTHVPLVIFCILLGAMLLRCWLTGSQRDHGSGPHGFHTHSVRPPRLSYGMISGLSLLRPSAPFLWSRTLASCAGGSCVRAWTSIR